MPNYFARANGNINATNVWATTPAGTPAAQTFVAGDVLYANNFLITVNVSTDLGSTGEVRNDNTNGAAPSGSFILSNGVTLTANVIQGAHGVVCVIFSGTSGNSATIVGNCTGGAANNAVAVNNTSTGTLNIQGNVVAGITGGGGAHGCNNASSGTLNIVGNLTGGLGTASNANSFGANNAGTGTINVTGNCTGGNGTGGAQSHGVANSSTGIVNITGNCTGGGGVNGISSGAGNISTGTINITGNCTGGGSSASNHGANNVGAGLLVITGNCTGSATIAASGAFNNVAGTMIVTGSIFATEQASGVGGANRAQVTRLTGPFYTSPVFGVNPNTCVSWRWDTVLSNTTFIQVPTQTLATLRNFVTPDNATNFPSVSNVRSGTTYGIGGALSGTMSVPPAASTVLGVPVDNTTGTATLTPADFWNAAISGLNTSGSIGERLKNVATVSTTGQALSDALSPVP